ncbi:MAG: hypothetical protein AAFY08_02300 [Planctomycetota bacterium]
MNHLLRVAFAALAPLVFAGCTSNPSADLATLYNRSAQYDAPDRNPVVVIPGILGSRLVDPDTGRVVWGAFDGSSINPKRPADARTLALPMREGVPLNQLADGVAVDGALDRVNLNLLFVPVQLDAYRQILFSLGAGGYIDQQLVESGAMPVDYGDDHFTCFQFAYDWRRDNVENAKRLHDYLLDRKAYVMAEYAKRYGGSPEDYADVRFDLVAHSMGGLIARYLLRYGDADVLAADTPPQPTWAGAELIDRLVVVCTPNAGSALAFTQLAWGYKPAMFLPDYPPALIGTFPSVYQLLPRARHDALVNAHTGSPIDPLDPDAWVTNQWGLANPNQVNALADLLPDTPDDDARRAIAIDHLSKSLTRARRFQAALDRPASPPPGTTIHAFIGDAEATPRSLAFDPATGQITFAQHAPGDGTVARYSVLLDERQSVDTPWQPRLVSPIDWSTVIFLFENHLGLTQSAEFTDNLLYLLLESPR